MRVRRQIGKNVSDSNTLPVRKASEVSGFGRRNAAGAWAKDGQDERFEPNGIVHQNPLPCDELGRARPKPRPG
jgi:hypothetical protein